MPRDATATVDWLNVIVKPFVHMGLCKEKLIFAEKWCSVLFSITFSLDFLFSKWLMAMIECDGICDFLKMKTVDVKISDVLVFALMAVGFA